MDKETLENIKEYVLSNDETISEIELFYNLEGDWVLSYVQDGQKKLITIDYID